MGLSFKTELLETSTLPTSSKLIILSHLCPPTLNTLPHSRQQVKMSQIRQDQGRTTCIQMSTIKESRWWLLWQPIVKAYTLNKDSSRSDKDTQHLHRLAQVSLLIYPLNTPISCIMMMYPALQWWVTLSMRVARPMIDRPCNSIFLRINLSMMTLRKITLGVTSNTS